ncbi:MAG TPA: NAD(P)H-dependent oxidoreductase [Methanocella sp.]
MRVIAIDTSPEKDRGAVSALLDPFLDGMRVSGADVELYYSRDLLIFPCCGNLNCTIRTPGQCMAYDDMRWLRQKIGQADVLVLASPLYFNGATGPAGITESMKLLQDRLVPDEGLGSDKPYEHALHTTREPVNLRRVVIVSGCGFWEIEGFYPVLTHLKAFCYNTFPELAGCITGFHPVTTRGVMENVSPAEMAEVARNAGRDAGSAAAGPAMSVAACDGGKAVPEKRRQWEPVMLFDYGMMR